jgi:hypothetical protein
MSLLIALLVLASAAVFILNAIVLYRWPKHRRREAREGAGFFAGGRCRHPPPRLPVLLTTFVVTLV